MQWFDLSFGPSEEPAGIRELPENVAHPEATLEFHVHVRRERTFGVCILANGRVFRAVEAGIS